MHPEPLVPSPEVRRSAEHVGADEHSSVGPPERDLHPGAFVLDDDRSERAERPLRNDVMSDTEPGSERGAVAVVPVEQLEDAGRRACGADPLLDSIPVDGIDHPDPAVLDESVRAALHELVDDPAEPTVELVTETDLQRCHIAAQVSTWGKSAAVAAAISSSTSNGTRLNETSSSSLTIAYSLQGRNGTGSTGSVCS